MQTESSLNGETPEPIVSTPAMSNRQVLALIASGVLYIDEEYGMRQWALLMQDLALLQANVPFAALGFKQRREQCLAQVLMPVEGATAQYDLVSDHRLLYNEKLTPSGSFALLHLNGVMQTDGGLCTPGARDMVDDLRAAYSNRNIAGVILEANSGGGEALAMEMLVGALGERTKPVLGFAHYAGSAAYGTLSATDEIIAATPQSQLGSVGAVISLNQKFLTEYKDTFISFYGENAPDKNKEFRAALAGDFGPLQRKANAATDAFQSDVAQRRGLNLRDAGDRQTLNGGMFPAKEAKKLGLVDGVGNMNYTLQRADAWVRKYSKQTA